MAVALLLATELAIALDERLEEILEDERLELMALLVCATELDKRLELMTAAELEERLELITTAELDERLELIAITLLATLDEVTTPDGLP